MPRYAIFKDGRQSSPDYATESAAQWMALASGLVVHEAADFDNVSRNVLVDGYEIKAVEDD